ncbi:MAG: rhodanese-like domain-containing protein [Pseudomonadota bacterium]
MPVRVLITATRPSNCDQPAPSFAHENAYGRLVVAHALRSSFLLTAHATRVLALSLTVIALLCASAVQATELNWPDTKDWVRSEFPDAPQITVADLFETLAEPTLLIDVRDVEEYDVSHLPGALNAQDEALEQLVRDVDTDRQIVLYCSVGYRSSRATEMLRDQGFDNVSNLEGSIFEWANEGHPLVVGGPDSSTPTSFVHPFDEEWGTLLDAERHSYVAK